jgi:uncharacterized protein YueI
MAARTHHTPQHVIEPEGRKWHVYTRPVRVFVGTFARLCDAMDEAERREQEHETQRTGPMTEAEANKLLYKIITGEEA